MSRHFLRYGGTMFFRKAYKGDAMLTSRIPVRVMGESVNITLLLLYLLTPDPLECLLEYLWTSSVRYNFPSWGPRHAPLHLWSETILH